MEITQQDRDFLSAFGSALLALAASALILLAGSYIYYKISAPGGGGNTYSKTIPGKQFKPIMGTAETEGDQLKITGFKTHDHNAHALVSLKTKFRAENYPLLAYQFEGWHTGMRINFIWRTTNSGRRLSTTILNRSLDDPGILNLAKEPNWRGSVTEIGFHVVGGKRDKVLEIPEITLEPSNWWRWLQSAWSEWMAFKGWSGTSINFLQGTPGAPGSATLSPTVAMALWSGLGLLCLFAVCAIQSRHNPISYGIVILIPWIAMDLSWQGELQTQLTETKTTFAGKSMHQKHLADSDRHIYMHAQRLKAEALPTSPARVFILHESGGHNYERLKTQYYLLPHNVYNFGKVPPSHGIHPGDYILALGPSPELTFDPKYSRLSWSGGNDLEVELIDTDPLGQLYRVSPAAEEVPPVGMPETRSLQNG